MVVMDSYTTDTPSSPVVRINSFKTKFFWLRPKGAFEKVDVDLGGSTNGMKIMTYGFIDDDMRNDLVTVN